MFKWIRALKVMLRARSAQFDGISRVEFRVMPWDIDLNLHLTNSQYLSLMDLGRFDLLLRARLVHKAWSEGYRIALVELQLKFRKELRIGQRFRLETRAVGIQGKVVELEQLILVGDQVYTRVQGKLLVLQRGKVVSPEPLRPWLTPRPDLLHWRLNDRPPAGADAGENPAPEETDV